LLLTSCTNSTCYLWYVEKTNLNEFKKVNNKKTSVVALLDSGFDYDYSTFINIENFINCYDFVDDDENIDSKLNQHGTRLAMIMASQATNTFCGVDEDLKFINLRVIKDDGTTTNEIIHKAFNYLKKYDVDVINLSFGSSIYNETVAEDISYFINKGTYVVSSVGDNLKSEFFYPSLYENVLSITAIDENNNPYLYSNTSKTKKTIYCPGVNISIPTYNFENEFNNINYSGSSYAAAFFSAVLSSSISKGLDIENLNKLELYDESGFFNCLKLLK